MLELYNKKEDLANGGGGGGPSTVCSTRATNFEVHCYTKTIDQSVRVCVPCNFLPEYPFCCVPFALLTAYSAYTRDESRGSVLTGVSRFQTVAVKSIVVGPSQRSRTSAGAVSALTTGQLVPSRYSCHETVSSSLNHPCFF